MTFGLNFEKGNSLPVFFVAKSTPDTDPDPDGTSPLTAWDVGVDEVTATSKISLSSSSPLKY